MLLWDAAWVLQGGRIVWGCLEGLIQTIPHHKVGLRCLCLKYAPRT